MSQSASRMLPSYGVALGKPTMVPLACRQRMKQADWLTAALHHKHGVFESPNTDQFVVLQLFGVDAVGVPDAPVYFANSDTLCSVTMKITHGVKADVTKTLQTQQRVPFFKSVRSESVHSLIPDSY